MPLRRFQALLYRVYHFFFNIFNIYSFKFLHLDLFKPILFTEQLRHFKEARLIL